MKKRAFDKMMKDVFVKDPIQIKNGEFVFDWCCDCCLRHVSYYQIIRGETPEKDVVDITTVRDSLGTELRRLYERNEKRRKKRDVR